MGGTFFLFVKIVTARGKNLLNDSSITYVQNISTFQVIILFFCIEVKVCEYHDFFMSVTSWTLFCDSKDKLIWFSAHRGSSLNRKFVGGIRVLCLRSLLCFFLLQKRSLTKKWNSWTNISWQIYLNLLLIFYADIYFCNYISTQKKLRGTFHNYEYLVINLPFILF